MCIADFEYLISKKGEPYGWGVARYCTPEAMYPDLFEGENGLKDKVEGRTPKQSREHIIDHLQTLFPDVEMAKIEKLI